MPYYPKLKQGKATRVMMDAFLGYNHNPKIADGEFYETLNLSNRYFPLLTTRQKHGILNNTFTNLQAIISKDALYWVDNGTLYANGYATGLTGLQTELETQLVSMGAYICVFPDKKYINTQDLTDYGSMGASWNYTGSITYTMCHADGEYYTNVVKTDTEPEDPDNGEVWIDTVEGNVKEYSAYTQSWIVIETVYTRVDFLSMGQISTAFKEYDGVDISGLYYDDLNGSKILYAVGGDQNTSYDYVVLVGIQEEQYRGQRDDCSECAGHGLRVRGPEPAVGLLLRKRRHTESQRDLLLCARRLPELVSVSWSIYRQLAWLSRLRRAVHRLHQLSRHTDVLQGKRDPSGLRVLRGRSSDRRYPGARRAAGQLAQPCRGK